MSVHLAIIHLASFNFDPLGNGLAGFGKSLPTIVKTILLFGGVSVLMSRAEKLNHKLAAIASLVLAVSLPSPIPPSLADAVVVSVNTLVGSGLGLMTLLGGLALLKNDGPHWHLLGALVLLFGMYLVLVGSNIVH